MQPVNQLESHVAEQVSENDIGQVAKEAWDNAHDEYRLSPSMQDAFVVGFLLGASYGANRIAQAAKQP